MDLFDKLKQVRISKRARRGAVLGLCLCAAADMSLNWPLALRSLLMQALARPIPRSGWARI